MNKKEKWGGENVVVLGGGGGGVKEECEKRATCMAMDHRSSLVQGKFIGTLARIHVICLAVHWSLGHISLPLQSVRLDKRAWSLSNLQQPGTGSQPNYTFQMKFTIPIMRLSQYGQSGFGFSLANMGAWWFGVSEGKTTNNLADSNSSLITNSACDSEWVGMQKGMKNCSFCLCPDDWKAMGINRRVICNCCNKCQSGKWLLSNGDSFMHVNRELSRGTARELDSTERRCQAAGRSLWTLWVAAAITHKSCVQVRVTDTVWLRR